MARRGLLPSMSCALTHCKRAPTYPIFVAVAWSLTSPGRTQPGDDPRSIDWRVTARSTTAYTKLFREERERPVLVVNDLRSNMHFATRGSFKSVNGSRAAALLAWAAHHRGDRLGGIIFGDTKHRELKPRLGRRSALRFVHQLAEHPGLAKGSPHRLSKAPRHLLRPCRLCGALRGRAVWSSSSATSSVCHKWPSPICPVSPGIAKYWLFFMSDPLERELPPPGRYRIVSPTDENCDRYVRSSSAARLRKRVLQAAYRS